MIKDDPDNPTNLHIHTHDWQLNFGAALTIPRYREDRKQVLLSAPDSRFPLFNANFATILMANDQQRSK